MHTIKGMCTSASCSISIIKPLRVFYLQGVEISVNMVSKTFTRCVLYGQVNTGYAVKPREKITYC